MVSRKQYLIIPSLIVFMSACLCPSSTLIFNTADQEESTPNRTPIPPTSAETFTTPDRIDALPSPTTIEIRPSSTPVIMVVTPTANDLTASVEYLSCSRDSLTHLETCIGTAVTDNRLYVDFVSTGEISRYDLYSSRGGPSIGYIDVLRILSKSSEGKIVEIYLLLQAALDSDPGVNAFPDTFQMVYINEAIGPPSAVEGFKALLLDSMWQELFPLGSRWTFEFNEEALSNINLHTTEFDTDVYREGLKCFRMSMGSDCSDGLILIPEGIYK